MPKKSWTLGELASHIAHAQIWVPMTVNNDKLEMKSGEFKPYIATDVQDLLETFDENVEQARQAMGGLSDSGAAAMWSMWMDGNKILEMPKIAVLRTFVINHMIHHRGQLSVYLRMRNVPLPQVYGPTADEGQM